MNNTPSDPNEFVKAYVNNQVTNTTNNDQTSDPNSFVKSYVDNKTSGPHPMDDSYVTKAENDKGDQSYNNYCETFAEQLAYGRTGMYLTAQDAWDAYAKQGQAIQMDPMKAPRGALVYYGADSSNSNDGHVGFSDGMGNLVSATSNGVKTIPMIQWQQETGQKPLGFVIPNK